MAKSKAAVSVAATANPPAAAPVPAPAKSNFVYDDKSALLKEVRKLAGEAAKSAIARPEFLIQCAIAGAEGTIQPKPYNHKTKKEKDKSGASVPVKVDDVADVAMAFYNTISKSIEKTAVMDEKEIVRSNGDGDKKSPYLSVRKVVQAAAENPDFPDILDGKVRPLVIELKTAGAYKGNMQDAFVNVARASLKLDEGEELDDDAITVAILPKGGPDREYTEKGQFEKLLKLARTIRQGTEPDESRGTEGKPAFESEHIDAIIKLAEEYIAELTPVEEEKAAA
jgi:hypothetical protein